MKCHVCFRSLKKANFSTRTYKYYCKNHCTIGFYKTTHKCCYYRFIVDEYTLIGVNQNVKYTYISNSSGGLFPEIDYISIDLDNITIEVPKLYNKLMKLRVFA